MISLKNSSFWVVAFLAILFFASLTCLSFIEWWTVGVNKETGGYPWGHVNDNPWYYDNPNLYAYVILIETILLAVTVAFACWFLCQKNKTKVLYAFLGGLLVLFMIFINGNIQH